MKHSPFIMRPRGQLLQHPWEPQHHLLKGEKWMGRVVLPLASHHQRICWTFWIISSLQLHQAQILQQPRHHQLSHPICQLLLLLVLNQLLMCQIWGMMMTQSSSPLKRTRETWKANSGCSVTFLDVLFGLLNHPEWKDTNCATRNRQSSKWRGATNVLIVISNSIPWQNYSNTTVGNTRESKITNVESAARKSQTYKHTWG